MLRAHQKVVTPQGEGEITSGTFSPTMQQSIAFARVPKGVSRATPFTSRSVTRSPASVVKLPFVRNGKMLAV